MSMKSVVRPLLVVAFLGAFTPTASPAPAVEGFSESFVSRHNGHPYPDYGDDRHKGRVYICHLSPFTNLYIDVGISEDLARLNVKRQCEQGQGRGSIFCREQDAKCSAASIL